MSRIASRFAASRSLPAVILGIAASLAVSSAIAQGPREGPLFGSPALTCPTGSSSCEAIRPLFACNLANASTISKEGPLRGLVQVLNKECTVITAGTQLQVETTAESSVVYATSRGAHVGYVPRDLAVPPDAFPELPGVLHGIWLPSERHCRVYVREGPDYANDAASVLDIDAKDIGNIDFATRPLLMTRVGPQSWKIESYQASDNDPKIETVTVSLDRGVLSISTDQIRRIRCAGLTSRAGSAATEQPATPSPATSPPTPRRVGGDFPVSCKSWSGTVVRRTGLNTTRAVMVGIVTASDMQEYCERDPGGETKASGGRLTLSQCVQHNLAQDRRARLLSRANCRTGQISFTYGDRGPWRATFPLGRDADTSCISVMSTLIAQFRTLCPANAPRMLPPE